MLDMDVVYQRHAEMVFRFLMTLCRDEDTAEELTQETFYQAVRSSKNMTEAARSPPGSVRLRSICGFESWTEGGRRQACRFRKRWYPKILRWRKESVSRKKRWRYFGEYTFWMRPPRRFSCFG